MEMNHDAPGNVSQKGVNSNADNETGFDSHANTGGKKPDDELGFDPDSPDASDPAIDPPHPARTSNDPLPKGERPGDQDQ